MPLSGASPIQSGSVVRLGSFFFDPPPTTIEADKTAYVVEHETPGSEGGVVEYLGSRQSAFTLRGDLVSGGDFDINQLLAMKGTSQNFSVSSTIPGQVFASGPVVVEDVKFVYQGGVGYPWYGFAVKLRNTGAAAGGVTGLILQANVQVGLGFNFGVPGEAHTRHIPRGLPGATFVAPAYGHTFHNQRTEVGTTINYPILGLSTPVQRNYVGVRAS